MLLIFFFFSFFQARADIGGVGGGGGSSFGHDAPRFDPVVQYKEGVEYLQSGEYKKAASSFRKVLSVARKDANTNYLLGLAYVGQEEMKKARKRLVKAVKYDKKLFQARGLLGSVYMTLGENEKAEEQKQALILQHQECGDCEEKQKIENEIKRSSLKVQNGEQSRINFDFEQQNNADDNEKTYLEVVEFINLGEYQLALNSLRISAQTFGPHPDILTYQGFASRNLGEYQLALHYYQLALAVEPNHRGANEYLGEYFVEIGDMNSANEQLLILKRICDFGCEEAEELQRWIAAVDS